MSNSWQPIDDVQRATVKFFKVATGRLNLLVQRYVVYVLKHFNPENIFKIK